MASQMPAILFRPALVLALVGALAVPDAARAEGAPQQRPLATVDVRAFVGFGSGIAVDTWLWGRRMRVDLEAATVVPTQIDWGGLAIVVPVARTARGFFGLRAGDTLEYTATRDGWVSGSRFAHAPDVGVVGHLESSGGSTLEGQFGAEAVLRPEATICCDHAALPTSSLGVRLALRGELALSDTWAVVVQAGLRTADHLLEIKVLPTFSVGVRGDSRREPRGSGRQPGEPFRDQRDERVHYHLCGEVEPGGGPEQGAHGDRVIHAGGRLVNLVVRQD